MTAAPSDSYSTLYVVHGRDKPVLCGPNSTGPNLFIMEKPHTGFDGCLRVLLSCFRKRMSGCEGGGVLDWQINASRKRRFRAPRGDRPQIKDANKTELFWFHSHTSKSYSFIKFQYPMSQKVFGRVAGSRALG